MAGQNLNAITNDNTKKTDNVQFRVVPFGFPLTRDNESHNPGRQQYTSESTESYISRDAFSFFWLDRLWNPMIDQRTRWQSGPTDNTISDVVVDGCGFWTSPGGATADWNNAYGAGDPHKMAGMSMLNHNPDLKGLYSMGIGKRTSGTNEGMEYGVIGMSGYFKPDWDSRDASKGSISNIALKHGYVVYRCDATDQDFDEIGDTNDSFAAGCNDVFQVGKTLFPNFMSGEVQF